MMAFITTPNITKHAERHRTVRSSLPMYWQIATEEDNKDASAGIHVICFSNYVKNAVLYLMRWRIDETKFKSNLRSRHIV